MLQPTANIVITVFPDTLKILLDFSFLFDIKMMEEVFDSLVGRNLGIKCSIGKEACSVTYTRIWKGRDIALEIKRLIEEKQSEGKWLTIYCQVEGEGVARTEIK